MTTQRAQYRLDRINWMNFEMLQKINRILFSTQFCFENHLGDTWLLHRQKNFKWCLPVCKFHTLKSLTEIESQSCHFEESGLEVGKHQFRGSIQRCCKTRGSSRFHIKTFTSVVFLGECLSLKSLLPRDTCAGSCIYVNLKPPAVSYWFPFRENVLRLVGFPQQLSRWAAQMNIILSNQHQMLVVAKLLSFVYNGSSEGAIFSSNLNRKVIFVFLAFSRPFQMLGNGNRS